MKKLILVIVLITSFSCKEESKKKGKVEISLPQEKVEEVLNTLSIPNISLWKHKNIIISTGGISATGDSIYNLKRKEPSISAYTSINNFSVFEGSKYKITILVKRGEKGTLFGLRMTSIFPNRADAVFDLEKGVIKGTNNFGDFEKPQATIEPYGIDWYKCTLSAEVFINKMMIIFGPTNRDKIVSNWEGATNDNSDIFIIPTKVLLQEISL